ncbi:MAG TPA: type IV secretion system protein VirB9 [Hydrogenophaga sp.]|uniref:TrbG/VirB9 family P-type conjugative transfer protein n=1 Tax=Hydrogenophaga sp. TaxID=1904254 RepID=UPI0008BC45CB|nr:TrbG/VirB9 family P-type conjugative transfer protein [Hydrogenophaga sp.]OGA79094.1 MAG: type IV secretion system protein VirB9 [Burkholderiales bacterium GWE1_65_30]OGA91981.1 MAG: type IV secretion system protein VirB9 [Burkholderiales bacterium GWF1_66_17]HAX21048.1 type IV secretion system protein VirB9 [Hydrogenophaga sp.]HBU17728.1 type IV secretion system protein VirB9 [Hydrogenophaga sp.]
MKRTALTMLVACAVSSNLFAQPHAKPPDPRLRDVVYDPLAVVTVPVKRGMVTLVVFDTDEVITEVAVGKGGDCSKAEAVWCVAAQPGGRTLFVKAKSGADAPNNLAVVTDRRTHALRFVVLPDGDRQQPVYRLTVKAPAQPKPASGLSAKDLAALAALPPLPSLPSQPTPQQVVAERLQAKPNVMNTQYSLAEGDGSQDIVPTLVYDDGRFTYLRFPGNREVPAVFHVLGDGSETLVNARMEDDQLVVDRVSRRLMLRAGSAVVGIWNEAFDLEGSPAEGATTVPGVQRMLKAGHGSLDNLSTGVKP